MKVLMINTVCGIKSTGRICTELAEEFLRNGDSVMIAYGREEVPEKYKELAYHIGNQADVLFHAFMTRLFDNAGFNSKSATKKFLRWAEQYDPDLLWLHNLHGSYINIELLFSWIKSRPQMRVKWTLHDCWAFTGHCVYFSAVKCDKWKYGCDKCVQKGQYPSSLFFDNSKNNFDRKKKAFSGVPQLSLTVPSFWLKRLVENSFLNPYPIEVCYNKVNKTIFHPVKSDFISRNHLTGKKIVLGVASGWDDRKGIKDMVEIANLLPEEYRVVIVGVNKKQQRQLPDRMIKIGHTNNAQELAEIYSAADYFVNPSKEETFGLTTVEAVYCGATAIVYKNTACEEIVNVFGGIAVEQSAKSICDAILGIENG